MLDYYTSNSLTSCGNAGRAEDAAARNANLQPFDVAGVEAAPIVHANTDELDDYEIDNDDGIIAVGLGCAFCFLFWFLLGVIFWNPRNSAAFLDSVGTHVRIKSF